MKAFLVIVAMVVGTAGIAVVFFGDKLDTALLDTEDFTACFTDEIIAEMQMQSLIHNTPSVAVGLLEPTVNRTGRARADMIKRVGMEEVFERAKKVRSEHILERLEYHEKHGRLPESTVEQQIEDATVKCIERQQRFSMQVNQDAPSAPA